MRSTVLLWLVAGLTFSSGVQAQESRFLINQTPGLADIQLDYKRHDDTFDKGSSMTNLINAEYVRTIDEMTLFQIGVGFAQKDVRISEIKNNFSNETTLRKTGVSFTDINASLKTAWDQEKFTWYIGAVSSISPGAARNPRHLTAAPSSLSNIQVNDLSGYQTLGGVVGMQTYADKLALGAEFEARVYSNRSVDNMGGTLARSTDTAAFIPTISGFLEFPLVRKVNLGFHAAMSRPNFQLDRVIFGGPENRFQGQLYSEWIVDQETTATLEVGYSALTMPDVQERSSMNIGVRKAL